MEYFVIGSGAIGKRHHDNLTTLGAVSHLIPWRGLDLTELESRMAGRDGAMIIATASDVRLELAAICARLGLPVYIEKPVAIGLADLDRLYGILGPILSRSVAGFMMRYHPMICDLAGRDLAQVDSFAFSIGHDVHQWRKDWNFAGSYAARGSSGGVLLDLCHEIDLAKLLFPDVQMNGVASTAHPEFPGVDFDTTIDLAVKNGPFGTVQMDYLDPVGHRKIELKSGDGAAILDLLELTENGASSDLAANFERNDMFLGLMRDFINLANGDQADNPLVPRMDRMYETNRLIAHAWEAREFTTILEVAK